MKIIILIFGLFFSQITFADNVIYKCTSSTGEITYQNNVGDKSECTKTNFGSFPNINFFKSDNVKKTSNNASVSTANSFQEKNTNMSEEQKIRDSKRVLILTQELNQEKEQLNTVSLMLKNLKDTNSKDSAQISQLEELKNSHTNNITAIERELGYNKHVVKNSELKIEKASLEPNLNNQTMMVTKAIAPNSEVLPTTLPGSLNVNPSLSKSQVSIPKKEVIKTPVVNEVKIPNKIAPTPSEKNNNLDKRKSNGLGNSVVYSSGLSGMSKIKN